MRGGTDTEVKDREGRNPVREAAGAVEFDKYSEGREEMMQRGGSLS